MATRAAATVPAPVSHSDLSKPEAPAKPTANITVGSKLGQRRKDVRVQLQYLKDDPLYKTTKPLQVTPNFLDLEGRTNVRLDAGPLETLNDVRGREDQFTLDNNGFAYVKAPTNFTEWSSQQDIGRVYLKEMEDLLRREVDGCDEIIFYDARIRQAGDEGARVQGLSFNPFARQVHVDNTERSVKEKLHNIIDMKARLYVDEPNCGRARIINIWRPIKHPVYDCGLAIADGGTLRPGDVIECDRHRQDTGEYWDTMGVIKHRPGFDWYYMSLQDEPDVLLFKNYDSSMEVPARWCLHTAFDLPPDDMPAGAPTRESIEVRAFILTNPVGLSQPSGGIKENPLAQALEEGKLKHVDEEHSITDRLRTDIDEANEIKDAVLLIRRKEIRRLEGVCDALIKDRDKLKDQLEQSKEQINIQTGHNEALQNKVRALEQQLQRDHEDLLQQVNNLSKELSSARFYEQTRARDENGGLQGGPGNVLAYQAAPVRCTHALEIAQLHQFIEGQENEIKKWKAEALGVGNQAVSRTWQAGVDEAVRRKREEDEFAIKARVEATLKVEREKDQAIIKALTDEIAALKAAR